MQIRHIMRIKNKVLHGVCILLVAAALSLIIAQQAPAASCPYCGKVYGEPAPGDEARVYELRRQHEAECAKLHGRSGSGGGGGDPTMSMIMGAFNMVQGAVGYSDRVLDEARKEREQKAALEHAEEERKNQIQSDNMTERMSGDYQRQQKWEESKNKVLAMLKDGSAQEAPVNTGNEAAVELKPNIGEYLGIKTLFEKPMDGSAPVDLRDKGPSVLDAEKERAQLVQEDTKSYGNQLQELMSETDRMNVPPPAAHKHVREGVILGMLNPDESELYGTASPFTGNNFEEGDVYATTNTNGGSEFIRALVDNHFKGSYTLNTPYGKQLVERLNGKEFDILTAHSNGATIAEALIRKGVIKVDELNIIGGDRSMINKFGLQELIDTGKVKKITVWINPGDPIPIGSSCILPTPLKLTGPAPLDTTASFFARRLTGWNKPAAENVKYITLPVDKDENGQDKVNLDPLYNHDKIVYFHKIKQYNKL